MIQKPICFETLPCWQNTNTDEVSGLESLMSDGMVNTVCFFQNLDIKSSKIINVFVTVPPAMQICVKILIMHL